MDDFISIGKVSRLLGVHPDTVRLWEKNGKITSVRTKGNHRRYRVSDIRQMQLVESKTTRWNKLLSDDSELYEWLCFYEKNDPVMAEALAYAKRYSPDSCLNKQGRFYQFVLVAVLDHKVSKETENGLTKRSGISDA